jgi:hypothetical protein
MLRSIRRSRNLQPFTTDAIQNGMLRTAITIITQPKACCTLMWTFM